MVQAVLGVHVADGGAGAPGSAAAVAGVTVRMAGIPVSICVPE